MHNTHARAHTHARTGAHGPDGLQSDGDGPNGRDAKPDADVWQPDGRWPTPLASAAGPGRYVRELCKGAR